MESIGKRIKGRNKARIHVVNEKRRKELRAQERAAYKKQKLKKPPGYDSDLEDLNPVINNEPSVQESKKNKNPLRNVSQHNKSVKESFSRILKDLTLGKSVASSSGVRSRQEQNIVGYERLDLVVGNSTVASSSGLRDGFEENIGGNEKCSSEIRGSAVEKQVLEEVEIISDSESETEAKVKAPVKKQLHFDDGNKLSDSTTDSGDSSSETVEKEDDNVSVESLSTGNSSSSSFSSSSSSSSDDDLSAKDVVGDKDSDDDVDMREARPPSPVMKVAKPGRAPLGRFKRPASCLTRPVKEDKTKIQKLNHREEEQDEEVVEVVIKEQCNAVFICTHCGKENKGIPDAQSSFIRPQIPTRVEYDDMNQNNFDSPDQKFEDSASINTSRSPEKPPTSIPEMVNPETVKEVTTPEKLSPPEMVSPETEQEVKTPEKPEMETPETVKKVESPEKTSTFRPDIVNSEKAKEVQVPEKPSRHEIWNSDKEKEVQAPEKPSRHDIHSSYKAKEVQVPEKPSRHDIHSSYKAKEVQVPEKPSRHDINSSYKAKEVQVPDKPSRTESNNSHKAKEVQADNSSWSEIPAVSEAVAEALNKPALADPPVDVDDESDYSMSSEDKSEDESEASLKDNEVNNRGWRVLDGSSKEVDLFRLLVNSVWQKDHLGEDEEQDELVSSLEEEEEHSEDVDQRRYDDDGLLIIRPPPLNENFGMEEPESPPVISERDQEEARLWNEFEFYQKSENAGIKLRSTLEKEISTDESLSARCKKGYHDLCLDIQIGLKCINCGFVEREMRSLDEYELGERIPSGRRKTDRFEEEEGSNSFTGKVGFEAPEKNSLNDGCVSTEGTVWDKIPGVKSQMYPHQQEGFEFIWKNLAGTIMLNELKNFENSDETGGCIMSHAPGTGKTRLTIMFLQAYLECFPTCKAVIIAPASLLLTWAEEFKKWNIKVPFHNLGSLEFTGKESKAALDLLMQKNSSARTTNEIRMVKIYSWIKSKSILGISYNLYEKLAGVKDEAKKTKKAREVKPVYELLKIREILMGKPGLLVLDEAHTPRNQRSCIWKTLSKVETQKRILLSGTPFQNNFQELCNVLGLARPKYLEKLTTTLKNSGMAVTKRGKRGLGNVINNRGIEELKTVMLPFVHVHKGSILQKSLPGLRECVVVLNPPELQKKVLQSIEVTHNQKTKNVFETEHKLSLVSVHPSLVSRCKLTAKESRTIDEALLAQLKKVRLDPDQSVKTRFLMEFIGLCEKMKEKVLVFSQYIDPLKLIMKHLVHRFNWKEEEDVLYMHGKLEQKQRQTLINEFNDPKSKAKVMLASTKACSEGINLVGASRVILLDVVWNPAVERQAISRAYRIGQKRIVYTYHLVAKGTPEGPKYCKQAQKDRISELVFACSSKQDKGKEKIDDAVTEDEVLDTMVKHKKLGDMFDNLIVHPKEADLVNGFNVLMP